MYKLILIITSISFNTWSFQIDLNNCKMELFRQGFPKECKNYKEKLLKMKAEGKEFKKNKNPMGSTIKVRHNIELPNSLKSK